MLVLNTLLIPYDIIMALTLGISYCKWHLVIQFDREPGLDFMLLFPYPRQLFLVQTYF